MMRISFSYVLGREIRKALEETKGKGLGTQPQKMPRHDIYLVGFKSPHYLHIELRSLV